MTQTHREYVKASPRDSSDEGEKPQSQGLFPVVNLVQGSQGSNLCLTP